MSRSLCEKCQNVYPSTSEGYGFYLDCWMVEKLESLIGTKAFNYEFECNLTGWMLKYAVPMDICPDCRKDGMK